MKLNADPGSAALLRYSVTERSSLSSSVQLLSFPGLPFVRQLAPGRFLPVQTQNVPCFRTSHPDNCTAFEKIHLTCQLVSAQLEIKPSTY